jgi:hypothetical protein
MTTPIATRKSGVIKYIDGRWQAGYYEGRCGIFTPVIDTNLHLCKEGLDVDFYVLEYWDRTEAQLIRINSLEDEATTFLHSQNKGKPTENGVMYSVDEVIELLKKYKAL